MLTWHSCAGKTAVERGWKADCELCGSVIKAMCEGSNSQCLYWHTHTMWGLLTLSRRRHYDEKSAEKLWAALPSYASLPITWNFFWQPLPGTKRSFTTASHSESLTLLDCGSSSRMRCSFKSAKAEKIEKNTGISVSIQTVGGTVFSTLRVYGGPHIR